MLSCKNKIKQVSTCWINRERGWQGGLFGFYHCGPGNAPLCPPCYWRPVSTKSQHLHTLAINLEAQICLSPVWTSANNESCIIGRLQTEPIRQILSVDVFSLARMVLKKFFLIICHYFKVRFHSHLKIWGILGEIADSRTGGGEPGTFHCAPQ